MSWRCNLEESKPLESRRPWVQILSECTWVSLSWSRSSKVCVVCIYRNSGSHGTASELMSIWSWGAKGRPSVLDRVKILANQDYIHHFKTLNMCSHCKWCRSSRGQSNPSRLDNQSKKKHKKILIPDKMKKKETWESLQLTRMLTGSGGGSVVSSSA